MDKKKKSMLELNRITCQEFKQAQKIPLVVVLDDVRSLNNIGSVFRTADALVVEQICLCGITATAAVPGIHRTALGAEESVEWIYEKDVIECVSHLRCKGYKICSIEQAHGSISLPQFVINRCEKYAIVLGNEVKGVNQKVVDSSD